MKEIEYLNMDLDLFYSINGYPIHFASAGGMIPLYYQNLELSDYDIPLKIRKCKPIYSNDKIIFNPKLRENIRFDERINEILILIEALFSKNGIYDYKVTKNLNNLNFLFDFYIRNIYGYSFIKMAKKGFISLDRFDISTPENNLYHWVVMPEDFLSNPKNYISLIPSCDNDEFLDFVNTNDPFDLISLLDSYMNNV